MLPSSGRTASKREEDEALAHDPHIHDTGEEEEEMTYLEIAMSIEAYEESLLLENQTISSAI